MLVMNEQNFKSIVWSDNARKGTTTYMKYVVYVIFFQYRKYWDMTKNIILRRMIQGIYIFCGSYMFSVLIYELA